MVEVSPSLLSPVVSRVASLHPALTLLVLFGSRARGDGRPDSDWDLGFVAAEGLDRDGLLADLVLALDTEKIDLVDLQRASGLVRYRAARDGIAMLDAGATAFERFWLEAVTFWCDAQHVLHAGYDDVLTQLGP